MTGLDQRLQTLEATVKRHEQLLSSRPAHETIDQLAGSRASLPEDRHSYHDATDPAPGSQQDIYLEVSGVQEVAAEGTFDGMAMAFLDEEDSGYFGENVY